MNQNDNSPKIGSFTGHKQLIFDTDTLVLHSALTFSQPKHVQKSQNGSANSQLSLHLWTEKCWNVTTQLVGVAGGTAGELLQLEDWHYLPQSV